jgi:HD-GYP domain-containing protein (c-di-GMP phosphodiesterase class II)
METAASRLTVLDVSKLLAFVGDLSMGQPVDHSMRTAGIARALAQAFGCSASDVAAAHHIALLRWSGCTANAMQFSEMLEDDVLGRARLLSTSLSGPSDNASPEKGQLLLYAIRVHCEVAVQIATLIGASPQVCEGLGVLFDSFADRRSSGSPAGSSTPIAVHLANLAGDIEVFSRESGFSKAMTRIATQGDRSYPPALVKYATREGRAWLSDLVERIDLDPTCDAAGQPDTNVGLELVADVVDLKIPWMTGYSRRVATAVQAGCEALAMDSSGAAEAYRAALIHGLGRASVPNAVWNAKNRLSLSYSERIRLVPYWTQRAALQIPALRAEAELASYAFERMNGCGYFRGSSVGKMSLEAQILALAVEWCDAQTPSPQRTGCSAEEASKALLDQARQGWFDPALTKRFTAAMSAATSSGRSPDRRASRRLLSERERQVLVRISLGDSTKVAAQVLGIGPGTVRTHVESILKKLGCTTRAAATLKAATLGLI